jgi:arylsulfatase A-like enzyme
MGEKHPNILLIMSDNHMAELLGCYGNDEIHSPNLDRLAGQGIQFDNAYCVNGMCSPCRASVLTGLMPSQHGIHTWLDDRIMDQWPTRWNGIGEFVTLPEILKAKGYDTALIGKYHLGDPSEAQNGFEHWVTFPLGHTRSFWNNRVIENGKTTVYPGHTVDYFTEHAVDYIRGHDASAERPFFLFLTYNAPYGHWPSIEGRARNRFADLYDQCEMKSIPREGVSSQAIERFLLRRYATGGGIDYSAHLRMPNDLTTLRNYFSQLTMVDDGVGRVLGALHAQGLDEDTLVIYTCDHGFSLGHNGYWGHGQATWPANAHRASTHIPLLVRHSGQIEVGQKNERMISQIDLFESVLNYVGVSEETGNGQSSSRNFTPMLRGVPLEWEDEVFIEQEEVRAIRTPQWLYMKRFKGSRTYPFEDELYDLARDPQEKSNLIAEEGYDEVAQSLSDRIDVFFQLNSVPRYDLWEGGSTKSNSDKPWLWEDAWGEEWKPVLG